MKTLKSKSNHRNLYFNFLWRCPSSIVLTCECLVFQLSQNLSSFVCLFVVSTLWKRKSHKSVRFALWCGWYWWLIFYVSPLVTHIFISKILGIKSQDTFIAIDCAIDYYPFWWEVPTKPLIRLFQKAKLRTHNLTFTEYSKLIIRIIIYNIKFEGSVKVNLLS